VGIPSSPAALLVALLAGISICLGGAWIAKRLRIDRSPPK